MDDLKKRLEGITKKYAECVDKMLGTELNMESLTAEEVGAVGSSFSLLNHAVATIERISCLQKVKDEESDGFELQRTVSIKREDVEKFLVAIQQISKPFELNKRQRAIVDYDPESPSVKISYFTANE